MQPQAKPAARLSGGRRPGRGQLPSAGRRQRRSAELRERIFRAALELFAERGLSSTTVEEITERADVGKGTFFNHFATKEHVLAGLAELQLSKVEAALAEARAGKEPVSGVLRKALAALSEEPGRSAELVRSLVAAVLTNADVRRIVAGRIARARERLSEVFRIGQDRCELARNAPPEALARTFQQLAFGGMVLWSLEPAGTLVDWQEESFEGVWKALAPAKPPRPPRGKPTSSGARPSPRHDSSRREAARRREGSP